MRLMFGGGLNENPYPSVHEAAEGSQNFDLQKDTPRMTPRRTFDHVHTATNGGDIRGIMQMTSRDQSQTTLVQAGDTVYSWDEPFILVGNCNAQSQLRDAYWPLDELMIISDLQKLTPVLVWDNDASTLSTLTTGLGTSLYAKYALVHRGRVWLFNVTTTTDTPHLLVASAFETPTSYDTTKRAQDYSFTEGTEAFYMVTPDLLPINGVALYREDLIISTLEGKLYRLTGTDSTNYAFTEYYAGSDAIGDEAIVATGNDVVYFKRGGAIESVRATAEYGDTSTDDLSRWIPEAVKDIHSAIAVYDQKNQKVLFFVTGKVLVLFKDILQGGAVVNEVGQKLPLSPWSIYTTRDPSQFNCSAAKYMRVPGTTATWNVFFGASDGRVFMLNGASDGDGGVYDIPLIRVSRYLDEQTSGLKFGQHILRGIVQYRRSSQDVDLNITVDWADAYTMSKATVPLKAAPEENPVVNYGGEVYYGGEFYYNQGFSFGRKISHQNCSWVGRGSGCTITLDSLTLRQYQVDHIDLL